MSTVTIEREKLEQWILKVIRTTKHVNNEAFVEMMMMRDDMNEVLKQARSAPVQEWMKPHPKCDEACLFQCTKGFTQFPECAKPAPVQEPPPECQTESERRAYAFGWWQALEANRAAPVQDTEAHYKGVIEGVQKLFNDKRSQPAPVQQKPLFADIIAQHPGLAEELKAMDEGFELGYKAGLAAAQQQWVNLTDEEIEDIVEECDGVGWDVAQAIKAKLRSQNT